MNFTSINNQLPNVLSYQNKATASKTTTMTALVKITIALLLSLLLASCGFDIQIGDMDGFGSGKKGNGIVTNEIRNVNQDFTEISASEGLIVYVTQADDFEISVEADENIIDLIGTDVKNGQIKGACHPKYWQGHQERIRFPAQYRSPEGLQWRPSQYQEQDPKRKDGNRWQ